MNKYEEIIYSLIYNSEKELPAEEMKILNQADAIYNTYNNLTKQLGCPLEIITKLRKANVIYRDDGVVFGFIGINFNDEDKLMLYNDDECNIFTSDLRLTDHKKTWWLKEDRSE